MKVAFIFSVLTILFIALAAQAGEVVVVSSYADSIPCDQNVAFPISQAKERVFEAARKQLGGEISLVSKLTLHSTVSYHAYMPENCRSQAAYAKGSFRLANDGGPFFAQLRGTGSDFDFNEPVAVKKAQKSLTEEITFACNGGGDIVKQEIELKAFTYYLSAAIHAQVQCHLN